MAETSDSADRRIEGRTPRILHRVEQGFYVAVATALALVGAALFVHVAYDFGSHVANGPFVEDLLDFLDGLLLVFIVTELLHTCGPSSKMASSGPSRS